VPVLIARDREQATGDAILDNLTARAIGAKLMPMLGGDVVPCTDASGAYAAIARAARIRHEPVNTPPASACSTFRTSMPITAGSNNGCGVSMASPRDTATVASAGEG
jgi:hypothetical protein